MPLQPEDGERFVNDSLDHAVIAPLDDGDFCGSAAALFPAISPALAGEEEQALMVRAVARRAAPVRKLPESV